MKKLALVLVLTTVCYSFLNAQAVHEEAFIDMVDRFQSTSYEEHLADNAPFYGEKQICFTPDSIWWYVISYESLVVDHGRVHDRRAYLNKRKMHSGDKWVKADFNPLFEHCRNNDMSLSFDPRNISTGHENGSRMNRITVNGEEVVVIFMTMISRSMKNINRFTELFIFYPQRLNDDGSITYAHTNETLTNNKIFGVKTIKNDMFYDTNGGKLQIDLNETHVGFRHINANGSVRVIHETERIK